MSVAGPAKVEKLMLGVVMYAVYELTSIVNNLKCDKALLCLDLCLPTTLGSSSRLPAPNYVVHFQFISVLYVIYKIPVRSESFLQHFYSIFNETFLNTCPVPCELHKW